MKYRRAPMRQQIRERLPPTLSARELLEHLPDGDERAELQRAMQARDLDAIRELLRRHSELASIHERVVGDPPTSSAPPPNAA